MGASLWHEEVPWQPDPAAAFLAFQIAYFQANHDPKAELIQLRDDARDSVKHEKADGDRYGLLAMFNSQLSDYENALAKPLPKDPAQLLALFRGLLPEGFANFLDVTDVNSAGGHHVTRIIAPENLTPLLGSAKPTRTQALVLREKLHTLIDRGESICFPIYTSSETPAYWFFVGLTCD